MNEVERRYWPDERTDKRVRCRICGKWVTLERSRLFWVGEGTIRTCEEGNQPHGERPESYIDCPLCGERIDLVEREDEEFTTVEYSRHVVARHPDAVTRFPDGTPMGVPYARVKEIARHQ